MKNKFNKKNIGIILLIVIVLGVGYLINYSFFQSVFINTDIDNKFYEAPVNTYFDDDNFYQCVVDAYNSKNKTSVAYTTSLSDSQLKTITSLSCDSKSIISAKGVEKLTSLTFLSFRDNQLTSLDVSKNTLLTTLYAEFNKLTSLDVSNNTVLKILDLRYNQLVSLNVSNNTALETLLIASNKLTSLDVSKNTSLVSLNVSGNKLINLNVNNNTKLTSLNLDSNQLTSLDLTKNTNLNTLYASYNPFGEDLYVYKGNKIQTEVKVKLPSQLIPTFLGYSYSGSSSVATVDSNGLVTALKAGNIKVYATFELATGEYHSTSTINVIEITSSKYVINDENDLIFIGSDNDVNTIKNNINVPEGITIDVDLSNNKLYVKRNSVVLNEFKLVKVSSNIYNLDNDYIYLGINEFNDNGIQVVNANALVEKSVDSDGNETAIKFIVKYNDIILKEYLLISVSSSKYVFNDDSIYIGNNSINLNNITLTYGAMKVEDNKLLINYNNNLLDSYYIVSVSSEVYDLSKDYIYIGTRSIDTSKILVVNGNVESNNDKVIIKYNNNVLFEYDLIKFNFNSYDVLGSTIIVSGDVSYDSFINDIVGNNGLTYKLFNGEEEVTNVNVLIDMKFKVYYNDIGVDEYTIINEYLRFDESLEIDDENTIINNVKSGTVINDIYDKIDTSGEVSILDKNDQVIESYDKNISTGSKFKIVLSSQTLHYVVSVRGDINGNGLVEVNDLVQVSKHVVKGNVITGMEYLNASDVNSDSKVDINDIIKMAKHIVKKTEL